ncbi:pyrroline-5-carboxylate reductase [Candidatus Roizmanbacteria bacterium]|nr:pyrroline-5-carboxylate reductase [Candidatus Roizmanbacteria bacterium]
MVKDILENKHIAIIGYGNMGKAIVQGLLDKKIVKRSQLVISNSSSENVDAVLKSQIIILCVKPQDMSSVITAITDITDIRFIDKLFISIAAGFSISSIQNHLGNKAKIIRVMPNLCAKIGESMSCWVRNKHITTHDVKVIRLLLSSFGQELEMQHEDDLNKVTAVSGSGPAFFFYFIEAFMESARKQGFDDGMSKLLIMQTLKGSLATLAQAAICVEDLRKQVTSKGGTTEAAIKIFEGRKFKQIFAQAIHAAYNRSRQLNFS